MHVYIYICVCVCVCVCVCIENQFFLFRSKNVLVQYFPLLEIKSSVYRNTEK